MQGKLSQHRFWKQILLSSRNSTKLQRTRQRRGVIRAQALYTQKSEICGQRQGRSNPTRQQHSLLPLGFTDILTTSDVFSGFPGGSVVKNLPAKAEDPDSVPGFGRSPGEGNGNPLQYSCLGNPMDIGAWRATVHRVAKSWT